MSNIPPRPAGQQERPLLVKLLSPPDAPVLQLCAVLCNPSKTAKKNQLSIIKKILITGNTCEKIHVNYKSSVGGDTECIKQKGI